MPAGGCPPASPAPPAAADLPAGQCHPPAGWCSGPTESVLCTCDSRGKQSGWAVACFAQAAQPARRPTRRQQTQAAARLGHGSTSSGSRPARCSSQARQGGRPSAPWAPAAAAALTATGCWWAASGPAAWSPRSLCAPRCRERGLGPRRRVLRGGKVLGSPPTACCPASRRSWRRQRVEGHGLRQQQASHAAGGVVRVAKVPERWCGLARAL